MLAININFQIDPDAAQQAMMLEWLKTCRRLYNRCLRDLKDWINSRKCLVDRCSLQKEYIMSADISFPSYLEPKRQLTQLNRCDHSRINDA